MLKRTSAVMYSNGEFLYICGGRDSNQVLCNNVIIYNIGKLQKFYFLLKIQDTDIWKVFKMSPSSEPIHTCFSYINQLLIVRGRVVEVAYNEGNEK